MDFTTYNPATDSLSSLVNAIFASGPGVSVVADSISTHTGLPIDLHTGLSLGEPSTIAFYDGLITQLQMGAGLMLTTGDPTPPNTNTATNYGVQTGSGSPDTDADLQATVDAAFPTAGALYDLTYLQFHINITDPSATGLTFNVLFASDEFPEFSSSPFVDVAGVYVNGQNYALFNNDPLKPLSILDVNAAYFIANSAGAIPIEYDGISVPLQVTAPVHMGDNVIKIAIADTGDTDYDSSIFVSGLQLVNYQGFGLSQQVTVTGEQEVDDGFGNQTYNGNALKNLIKLIGGHDVVNGGGGIDEVEINYLLTSYNWNGSQLGLSGSAGNSSQLINVERVKLDQYGGVVVALDTSPGGNAYNVVALLDALFDTTLSTPLALPLLQLAIAPVSQWVAYADHESGLGHGLNSVAQAMLTALAPGMSDTSLIGLLYHNIFGSTATPDMINYIDGFVGTPAFPTMADLFATAALLPQNTADLDAAHFTGSMLVMDPAFF